MKGSKIIDLRQAAVNYVKADKDLEIACGLTHDPIACTVNALKEIKDVPHIRDENVPNLPEQSRDAAYWLSKVVEYHGDLVNDFGMDSDGVRAIWFPILNQEKNF